MKTLTTIALLVLMLLPIGAIAQIVQSPLLNGQWFTAQTTDNSWCATYDAPSDPNKWACARTETKHEFGPWDLFEYCVAVVVPIVFLSYAVFIFPANLYKPEPPRRGRR